MASTAYHKPKLPRAAPDAITNACQPLTGGPISPPPTPVTVGRNQATPLSRHALEIRRYGLLILMPLGATILIRHEYMHKMPAESKLTPVGNPPLQFVRNE
jgi:hypothetical protein